MRRGFYQKSQENRGESMVGGTYYRKSSVKKRDSRFVIFVNMQVIHDLFTWWGQEPDCNMGKAQESITQSFTNWKTQELREQNKMQEAFLL